MESGKLFLNEQFQIIGVHQQKTILSEIYQKFEFKPAHEFLFAEMEMFQKGKEYLKINGNILVLCHLINGTDIWKYSIDHTFLQDSI